MPAPRPRRPGCALSRPLLAALTVLVGCSGGAEATESDTEGASASAGTATTTTTGTASTASETASTGETTTTTTTVTTTTVTATTDTTSTTSTGETTTTTTGADDCAPLRLASLPASPIDWTGFPACDPLSNFCIEYPAPMNGLGRAGMSPTGTAYTVVSNTVARWKDGKGDVYRLPSTQLYGDVYAISDTDVWIVGSDSQVAHFDGVNWTMSQLDDPSWLGGVWASGPTDVWAVGNFGVVGHYDGTWTSSKLPGSPSLYDVAGTGPADVWAVGTKVDGVVYHWDGVAWTELVVDAPDWLEAVWATSPDDVWAVGRSGIVLHGDAQGLEPVEIPVVTDPDDFYWDVWGSSPADVWIMGSHDLLHFDGVEWTRADRIGTHLFGRGASDVIALGGAALRWDGGAWVEEFSIEHPDLNAAWAVAAGEAWFVGDDGEVMRAKDGELLRGTLGGSKLSAIWAAGPDDVWIAGQGGKIYRGDGVEFCAFDAPTLGIDAISGSDANNVWVTASFDEVHRWDGATWTMMEVADADWVLTFSPTDTWVSGDAVRHWDGAKWTIHGGGGFGDHFGPLWGATPDDLWVAESSSMYHWDGNTLAEFSNHGSAFAALAGSAPDDVWSIDSTIDRFDGVSWENVPSGRISVHAAAVTATDVWAVGDNSLVLHKLK